MASSGSSFLIDYKLEIVPLSSKVVEISYISDENTDMIIEYIAKGIERFILEEKKNGVQINGFQIIIKEAVVSITDFKPHRFESHTYANLFQIFYKNGNLIYLKNPFKNYEQKFSELIFESQSFQINNYDIYPFRKHLDLPETNKKNLVLPENIIFRKEINYDWDEHKCNLSLSVSGKKYSQRGHNYCQIVSNTDIHNVKAMFVVNSCVESLIKEIYDEGYNLGSIQIIIDSAKFGSLDYDDFNIQENSPINRDIFWFLKEILVENNDIDFL